MIMSCTKLSKSLLFGMLGAMTAISFGQENFTAYLQPAIGLNYEVSATYSHNLSVQNRNYIYNDERAVLEVRQIDIAHFSNFQIQDNQSLAFGILYRFRENFDGGNNELRLTQQYNIKLKPNIVRYGHRLRSEQRITRTKTIHRFRYRFSLDRPLKGEKLDLGEPYFVANVEKLLSVSKSKPQYDTRFKLNFGWKLSEKTKFQIGTEYRLEDYSQDLEQVLFFLTGLNISL